MFDAERAAVAAAARRLAAEGLVAGTAGNLSARCGDGVFAVSPTGATLGTLTAEQVTVVDAGGRVAHGDFEPTSELDLHLGIYRRHDAGAVVHTHAPMSTALACSVDEVPCVHYQMLSLGGAIRVAPYHTFGSAELAQAVGDALEGRRAALLGNHGAVTYGKDLDAAVEATLLLEWVCGVYWRARLLATPRILDDEQQQAVILAAIERGYGAVRAVGDAEGQR
ncbi:MAG TPA: class II aldolase/adducin family protein [Candidatus Dormibacteraeota bacterium]|nr:class II aldolase/adducin family protein [Candidatus Dormibacteraeota bacterium]